MMGRNSVRSGPGLNLVLCEIEYRLLISVLSGVYLCWLIVSTKVFFGGSSHPLRTYREVRQLDGVCQVLVQCRTKKEIFILFRWEIVSSNLIYYPHNSPSYTTRHK